MHKEIERKFLPASDAWRSLAARRREMRQGYIAAGAGISVRVRIAGAQARLNIKHGGLTAVRDEYEYPIPLADARALLDGAGGPIIEKTRHYVPHAGREWEVDEFRGENAGLVVAEIELGDEHEQFPAPPWIGKEVTHLQRYYNVSLVQHPYSKWSDAERNP